MNEAVVKVLKENLWHIATFGEEPNVVPVGFKDVTDDGKLVVGDVFMEATAKNVKANGKVAIAAATPKSEGYQVKGTAEYVTSGALFDAYQKKAAEVFHGAMAIKGLLVITPEKVIVTTPGADNKKVL